MTELALGAAVSLAIATVVVALVVLAAVGRFARALDEEQNR